MRILLSQERTFFNPFSITSFLNFSRVRGCVFGCRSFSYFYCFEGKDERTMFHIGAPFQIVLTSVKFCNGVSILLL